jgi:TonB family protein
VGGGARVSGSGSHAGSGGGGGVDRGALEREILARIRAVRQYPELARHREIEGRVTVSFLIDGDGRTHAARVTKSADPLLDRAALDAVARAEPLPRLDGPVEVELDFQLSE